MKKVYLLGLLCICFGSYGQTYHYNFNNNLNEAGGGPALTDTLTCSASAGTYSSQTVCTGGTKNVFDFNQGEGLIFRNDAGFIVPSSSYTINILMKFNALNAGPPNPTGAQRIINFDTATNMGLYSFPPSFPIPDGVVHFYDGTAPSSNDNKEILANTYFLYSIVRIGGGVDSVYFYINGVKSDSAHDNNQYLAPGTNQPIWLFIDNGITGSPTYICETGAGSISYLSLSNSSFTPTQIDSTWKAQCPTVLPLLLLDFQASKQSGSVALSWTTTNEVNTSHIDIERSADGIHFSTLATVATNNNISTNNYNYTDRQPQSTNFYRLKMVDIDGKFSYSSVLKISFSDALRFEVYPNPVRNTLTISGINGNEIIKLLSSDGKLLIQKRASGQSMTMDMSTYSPGLYILQYFDGTKVQSRKIVRE